MIVQFTRYRFREYTDPHEFHRHAAHWLELREAENCFILGHMTEIMEGIREPKHSSRAFVLEEDGAVVAVAVLFPNGCLALSWALRPMLEAFVNHLAASGCKISSVYAPAHVSWPFAQLWTQRTGQRFEFGPEERVYQLIRLQNMPSVSGTMEQATEADADLVGPWLEDWARECHFVDQRLAWTRDVLIRQRQLYLWKDPHPVAMAAWVMPTIHGGCINFVYTAPAFRGRGYGKAVVFNLAKRMLESGLQFCFILTDPADARVNALYQKLGARTLCEFMHCPILPLNGHVDVQTINGRLKAMASM